MTPLERAIDLAGGIAPLARLIQQQPATVSAWLNRGRRRGRIVAPAEHCPSIELALRGAVTCEELNASVRWDVLRLGWERAQAAVSEAATASAQAS